jgi:hypothetical protein
MPDIEETHRAIIASTRAKPQGEEHVGHCPAHKDKNPSLSIGRGKEGRILLKCHANCTTHAICKALGIGQWDLFPPKPKYEVEATYDYRDESGALLFQSVRFRIRDPAAFPLEPRKTFKQRAPEGMGWRWSLKGVRRVLYRLPEILAKPEAAVWIVEGEKDVDCLTYCGLVSTCNPMGAGKWLVEFCQHLHGREVIIIPDNDAPGREHAEDVAAMVYAEARSVRILSLPGLPEHGDVSDWLDAGHDCDELCAMSLAAPEWKPDPDAKPRGNGKAEGSIVQSALSKIVTAQSILRTDYPEPRWAVKGVIPEGTTIIAGPPKLGKSVFCLNVAVSVSQGSKALSYFDVEQGAVLYLALEDSERRIKKRLEKLLGKPKDLSSYLEVVTRWPRLNEGGLEAIQEWILRHGDYARLIIVDTFKRIRPLKGSHHKNASTYDMDYDDVVPLTDLTIECGVALNLVAHTRKAEAEDVLAMISGSYGLSGAADGALILARKRNSKTATLSVIGRDVEEQELALEFNPDFFMWSALGKSSEVVMRNERIDIIELLKNSDEPLSPGDISGILDKTPGATRKLLWTMKSQGQIKDFGRRYQLPDFVFPAKQNTNKPKAKKAAKQMSLEAHGNGKNVS